MIRRNIRLGLLKALPKLSAPLLTGNQDGSRTSPHKIVLIRPDHLGDLLFTSPALRVLKERFPESEITMLVGPWSLEVAQHIPGVDHVITCPFTWFDRRPKGSPFRPYRLAFEESRKLRGLELDLAINLRFDFWWGALLAYLAGIPVRLGYDVPECSPFLTKAIPYESRRHEVLQNLSLTRALIHSSDEQAKSLSPPGVDVGTQAAMLDDTANNLRLEVRTTDDEERFAAGWLAAIGPKGPLIAIHPGAGAPVKLWASDRYVEIINKIVKDHGATVVLTGSDAERPLLEEISNRSGHPIKTLIGASLGELAAALKRCSLVIGSDSGVLHLAVAVGTPTVHLYGPVSTESFGPWGESVQHRVIISPYPCVPCDVLDYSPGELAAHGCMAAVRTDVVLKEVTRMLMEAELAHRY